MILMRLPFLLMMLAGFFLTFLFHSHVVSNDATGGGAENGVMVHEMTGHRADRRAFEAAFRFGSRNAAQRKACGNRRDHNMSHGWTLPTVFWTSGKA